MTKSKRKKKKKKVVKRDVMGRPTKKDSDKGVRYSIFVDAEVDRRWKAMLSNTEKFKNNSQAVCHAMSLLEKRLRHKA